jgi:hypothetical protein
MEKHQSKITIRPNPASVADAGKVRLGGESPSFGPVRAAPAKFHDRIDAAEAVLQHAVRNPER